MHRDVSADVQAAPSSCREVQQRDCDRWRKEFNSVRPHESLKNQVPADLYKASPLRPRARIATYKVCWGRGGSPAGRVNGRRNGASASKVTSHGETMVEKLLARKGPVSYTHLTLPTKRIV